uniref:Protein prune-like protein n=1 Tax=Callorhinchus milii TaxID=7868 RepID=V9KX53_CALMI
MEGMLAAASLRAREGTSRVHAVLGNEACDLDSMVSALAWAYCLTKTSPEQDKLFLPVLNIPRSEFALRTECTYFLREHRLPEGILTFRDDIDLHQLHRDSRLSLTLVDHNVLPSADWGLEEVVREVIDHRAVERVSAPGCEVLAELVGSCATLIAHRILQRAPHLLDSQLTAMLRDTILLDCVNMAPEAGKVTPKDTEIVAMLESRFPELPAHPDVFNSLQSAKFDVSGLSTDQMLRKDMKVVTEGGVSLAISAVYLPLQVFLSRSCATQEIGQFCRRRGYDALVAMTISFGENQQPSRQLGVYSESPALRQAICRALEDSERPNLCLWPVPNPQPHTLSTFSQGNTQASRKKVLPLLMSFLKTWSPSAESEGLGLDRGGGGSEEDTPPPPTPMNSLVEGCPLDAGLPRLTAEAILEKFSQMGRSSEETQASGLA